MKQATHFSVHKGWEIMLQDMGINPADIIKQANIPNTIFNRKSQSIRAEEYFKIWHALEALTDDKELPLLLSEHICVETFEPSIFACLCSPDINMAFQRLSQYKRMVSPVTLTVDISPAKTRTSVSCYGFNGAMPYSFICNELIYLTKMVRIATRKNIVPINIVMQRPPNNPAAYHEYFGTDIHAGNDNFIEFSAQDAKQPFITANASIWRFFEPQLQQKHSHLNTTASTTDKVRSVLLEMLPRGQNNMEQTAQRLTVSKRTLQRHLNNEGTNYQSILKNIREELAKYYLSKTDISPSEISFLLGFHDSNSFIRAFNNWTGKTPGQFRSNRQNTDTTT